MNARRLHQLARQWRWAFAARDLAYAVAAGCAVIAATLFWPGKPGRVLWPLLAASAATLAIRFAISRWWMLDAPRLARHLNRVHPELEESSELWLRAPEQLALLEQLQLKRVNSAIYSAKFYGPSGPTLGRPPKSVLIVPLACLLAASGLLIGAALYLRAHPAAPATASLPGASARPTPATPPPSATGAWPKLLGGSLTVTPPAYTGHPARQVNGLGAEVEEGSTVAWSLTLDRPVRDARLVFGESGTDTLPLAVDAQRLAASRRVAETGFYHLAATLPDGRAWNPPELYSLKVLKDQPPTVRILRPEAARTVLDPPPPGQPAPRVEVEVAAGDDYGVADAHLVATVAKGSGEAVKFHEQSLPFDTNDADPAAPHGRRLRRTLDFGTLGLEPGDELYFFVEVTDNRQPVPNRTRSETRFLVLKGPEETAPSVGRGVVGVNLVPQYFRSERQIIIDTEKLIADRPKISDHELRQRANDLGGDQQLLRLRYGQFLGEDLEQGTGDHEEVSLNPLQATPPPQTVGPRAAASLSQRFLQEHEQQDRTGGSDEQREANPQTNRTGPVRSAQAVAPFVDQHDSQDKATLFDQSTKGTMRDALDAMWAAERHLRVLQLDDALAPEHRALDILKDLQQSARSYVQRVGFEPPPLKVDQRRLKGDVAGVPPRAAAADPLPPDDPAVQAARAALAALPWHRLPPVTLAPADLDLLGRLEPALLAAATRQPDRFLAGLQALRQLRAGSGDGDATPLLGALEPALLRLLPPASPLPGRTADAAPSLGNAYLDALQRAAPAAGGPPP